MKDLEKLAIAQALYKAIGSVVSTKDKDSLRSKCDKYLQDLYADGVTDRLILKLNDTQVGSLTLRKSRGEDKVTAQISDIELYLAWIGEADYAIQAKLLSGGEKEIAKYIKETGDVPDGVTPLIEHVTKGEVVGTTIKDCKPEDVAQALGSGLTEAVVGLLEE